MNLNSTDMSVVTFCIVHGANAGDRMAFWGKRGAYVAVWEVVDRTIRIVEVNYVGTREDAPY